MQLGREGVIPAPVQRGWSAGQPGRDAGMLGLSPELLDDSEMLDSSSSRSPSGYRCVLLHTHTHPHTPTDWLSD